MKKIVAVIPVRAGSERVKNKNTRSFCDTTLLDHKIKVLKKINSKLLSEIVVNTNCIKAISIAKKHNVKIHIRDDYYASSIITNDKNWKNLAENTEAETIVLAQVTSPFVKVETYEKAILKFLNSEYDSINSVSMEKKFLWKDNKPLNYEYDNTPKSQDLPEIFSLNFAISIIDKIDMINKKNIVGKNPGFIYLDKFQSMDIDDEYDFDFCVNLYSKYKSIF